VLSTFLLVCFLFIISFRSFYFSTSFTQFLPVPVPPRFSFYPTVPSPVPLPPYPPSSYFIPLPSSPHIPVFCSHIPPPSIMQCCAPASLSQWWSNICPYLLKMVSGIPLMRMLVCWCCYGGEGELVPINNIIAYISRY
jgi:hypothetical protein